MAWVEAKTRIQLSRRDRHQLDELLSGGLQPVRTVLRAWRCDRWMMGSPPRRWESVSGFRPRRCGRSASAISRAVWSVRYIDAARPGQGSGAGSGTAATHHRGGLQSPPPEGRARWTVRLLTEEAIRRKLVPRVGRETIRVLLRKPRPEAVAGKKCGAWRSWTRSTSPAWRTCWGCMKSRSRRAGPVVCIDEKPVVLHADTRAPIPMKPGRDARRDYEYKRCGTANVFCGVEPKAGRHFTKVTPTRCSAEFADYLLEIAARYPAADTIHLVMDNLSTHTQRRWWNDSAKRLEVGCGTDSRCTTPPNMEAG